MAPAQAVDERGWWEKPEERSMQAYAVQPLDPWQEERLERAYAADGRRKMKVCVCACVRCPMPHGQHDTAAGTSHAVLYLYFPWHFGHPMYACMSVPPLPSNSPLRLWSPQEDPCAHLYPFTRIQVLTMVQSPLPSPSVPRPTLHSFISPSIHVRRFKPWPRSSASTGSAS